MAPADGRHAGDPAGDMVVVFLTQLAPSSSHTIREELSALVYAALVE